MPDLPPASAPAPRRATALSIGPTPVDVAGPRSLERGARHRGRGRDRLRSGHLAISDVNRSACDVTGRTADELIGHCIKGVLAGPEAARLGSIVAPVIAGTQDVSRAMVDIQRPDGEATTVEMVIQPITSADGGSALVAIARDIGERIEVQVRLQRLAQAEHARAAELNAVIRAMGEAVVVCAADGAITLTNPAAEHLFPDVDGPDLHDILAQLHDPAVAAPPLGHAGRPGGAAPRDDPDRWVEIATYPVTVGIGLATAGKRRSWSCAMSPRPADARPSGRPSSASCRTSSGRR